jgi:NADP-dependent 3-hydroxy acid dehydrogenase YdfG
VKVEIYSCDISDTAKISETVNSIKSDFGVIDVLINNAGIWQKRMQLDEVEKDMIDPIIQTNLSGVIHMTHSVLPIMRELSEAAVINVISQSGVVAQDGQSVYTATKFGIRGFTDVLKKDLADTNIRIA